MYRVHPKNYAHGLSLATFYCGYAPTDFTHIDGLVQKRRNSSALAMELRLSCTKPSICLWLTSLALGQL